MWRVIAPPRGWICFYILLSDGHKTQKYKQAGSLLVKSNKPAGSLYRNALPHTATWSRSVMFVYKAQHERGIQRGGATTAQQAMTDAIWDWGMISGAGLEEVWLSDLPPQLSPLNCLNCEMNWLVLGTIDWPTLETGTGQKVYDCSIGNAFTLREDVSVTLLTRAFILIDFYWIIW